MKLISIVIPVYNEAQNIAELYDRLQKTLKTCSYFFEIIFVNDGSVDHSGKLLEEISLQDKRIKMIEFARNFGKEFATSAGLHEAQGEACLMLDADLQHPPELIPEFLKKWEQGAEIAVGVRKNNKGGIIKRVGSYFFYKIIRLISETPILAGATDFRLLDKKVIKIFNQFTEHNRMTRGLIDWLGFKRECIYLEFPKRFKGKVAYSFSKLMKLAFSTFVAYSLFPLKFAGYLGILVTLISGLLGVFIIVERYILKDPWNLHFSSSAILAVFNLFLIGIVLSCLGLIALYISHIHFEVQNRPLYVIRRKINFD